MRLISKVLAAGVLAVAMSLSAGAAIATVDTPQDHHDHVDVVEVQAACNADGTQSASFLITNTSDSHSATITELNSTIGPITGAGIGTVIPAGGSVTVSITTAGNTTGTVQLSAELAFFDSEGHEVYREKHGNDDVVFTGGCSPTPPVTVIKEVPGPTTVVNHDVLVPVPVAVPVAVPVERVVIASQQVVSSQPRFTG